MYFCIKNFIGTKGEDLSTAKCFNPHVVYATDRSRAVVLVLLVFLSGFVVKLAGAAVQYICFTTGLFMLSNLALCSRIFQSCLALRSPRLWKREMVFICFCILHAFILVLFRFLLVSGIGCGL